VVSHLDGDTDERQSYLSLWDYNVVSYVEINVRKRYIRQLETTVVPPAVSLIGSDIHLLRAYLKPV